MFPGKFRIAIALLFAAALVAPTSRHLNAQEQSRQLVVHEWGTFTSVLTADGTAQQWDPFIGPSELPSFVYRSKAGPDIQCIKQTRGLVRMETPVLYFYPNREQKVSVKVDFPRGCVSEWYPQAIAVNPGIRWDGFLAGPGVRAEFPSDSSRSHYYPARETDAAAVRVTNGSKTENEKFLFYRGIGNFDLPLRVRLEAENVVVKNPAQNEVAQVILFENREGKIGWRVQNALKTEATLARPVLGQSMEDVGRLLLPELEKTLIAEGLYEKEARAMINTWRDSWFEEGTRVLYILPRCDTDAILPLRINPVPTALTRVMVGRAEIITPQMEKAILDAAKQYGETGSEARAQALAVVLKYGRFAEPVLHQARSSARSETERARIWELMTAAVAKKTVLNH